MASVDARLFGLSDEFGQVHDEVGLRAATAAALDVLIGGELVGWVGGSMDGAATIVNTAGMEDPGIVAALERNLSRHPILLATTRAPSLVAVRMSDLMDARTWSMHPVFNDLFRRMGTRYQLALPIAVTSTTYSCWAINRAGRDFDDADLRLANGILPLLGALELSLAAPLVRLDRDRARDIGLTAREADVLELLVAGRSAVQIAYLRRIGLRTVHKHVEHIYAKLGVHDRVGAVNAARRTHVVTT